MLEMDQAGLDDIVKYIAGFGRGIVEHARKLEDLQQQVDARFAALENLVGRAADSVGTPCLTEVGKAEYPGHALRKIVGSWPISCAIHCLTPIECSSNE